MVIRRIFGKWVPLWVLVSLCGCIREDRDGCPPEIGERFVVLKIEDAAGLDITENGEAGSAELFFFSDEGIYAGRFSVDGARITHHVPIPLPDRNFSRFYVSVWTNAGSGQRLHAPDAGSRIDQRAVSLFDDAGYQSMPDDLFFGSLQLAETPSDEPEVITVVRKNARMNITVRGLESDSSDERYYFTVRLPNDGYDFQGNLMSGSATLRRAGEFDEHGDFVTRRTFNAIHTDSSAGNDDVVTVCLYEKLTVRAADRLVVSVTANEDGLPIALPAGHTLNLLIDLGREAGLAVHTRITHWDEIYQWESW